MSKKAKTEQEVAKEDEVYLKYFEEIEKVNEDLAKISEEISKKQAAILKEYEPKKKPFFKKRAEIVSNIPNFWADAMLRHKVLESLIEEEDKEVLKHLKEIEYVILEDVEEGFKISFHFNNNPFFSDQTLWKSFIYKDGSWEITTSGINWKEGKDLTAAKESKKGKKRGPVESTSFFKWFHASEVEDDPEQDYVEQSIRAVWETPEKFYWGLESDDDDDLDDLDDEDDDDDLDDEADDE